MSDKYKIGSVVYCDSEKNPRMEFSWTDIKLEVIKVWGFGPWPYRCIDEGGRLGSFTEEELEYWSEKK